MKKELQTRTKWAIFACILVAIFFITNRDKIRHEKQKPDQEYPEFKQVPSKSKAADKFSPVDGENVELSYWIKNKLDDPESFEHVRTEWTEYDDHILVYTTFRFNNKFGAKTMTTYEVVLDLDDNIKSLKRIR